MVPVKHEGHVRICLLSDDGRHLVTAGNRPEIHVTEMRSPRRSFLLKGHTDVVNWAQFSPDGALLLSASRDKTLFLWSTRTWERIACMSGHEDSVEDCLFTPDGLNVLSLDKLGNNVRRWTVPDGQPDGILKLEETQTSQLFTSADARKLYIAMRNGNHLLTELVSFRTRGWFGAHSYVFNTMALLNRAGLISADSGYKSGKHPIALWDARNLSFHRELSGHLGEIRLCKPLPDGMRLLSGGEDCWIRIRNMETWEQDIAIPTPSIPFKASISAFQSLIAVNCLGGEWALYHLHHSDKTNPPYIAAWLDFDKRFHASCPLCYAEFGFNQSLFTPSKQPLGQETECPQGHKLWILSWPMGRVPIWCDPNYWHQFHDTQRRET